MAFYKLTLDEILDAWELTSAEQVLLGDPRSGARGFASAGFDKENNDIEIDGALIRFLLLGGDEHHQLGSDGVLISGAKITGILDFEGRATSSEIFFFGCQFENIPIFKKSRIAALTMSGGELLGFCGVEMMMNGPFRLHGGVWVTGMVDMSCAKLNGMLEFAHCMFTAGEQDALQFEEIEVAGDMSLSEAGVIKGRTNLRGAVIGEKLDFNHSSFNGMGSDALICGVYMSGVM